MAFERKESKVQKPSESSIIQSLDYRESTSNEYLVRSMGMALLRLSDRYFKGKDEKAIEQMCADTIKELNDAKGLMLDEELKAGIDHVLAKVAEPIDPLYDRVTLYLPVAGTSPLEYKDVAYIFPLKQVLTLSRLALNDDEQFTHLSADARNVQAKVYRHQSMYMSYRNLRAEGVCHLGHRHQFLFPLNRSAIDIQVIADGKTPILAHLKEHIYPLFWRKWFGATTDAAKKEIFSALYQWIERNDLRTLIALVDPDKTILASLKKLFIQHGSNPIGIEKEYELALSYTAFEADKKHPVLNYLHNLLTADNIENLDAYNQMMSQVKKWIESHFDLNNEKHHEWIKKIHALNQAQCLLHQHNTLLMLTGKKAPFNDLEKLIHEYIENFNIEALPDVPAAVLTQIERLKDEVRSSQKETLADKVESFFGLWYQADRDVNYDELRFLYSSLMTELQSRVYLTDETIQIIEARAIKRAKDTKESKDAKEEEPTVLFDCYEQNRFFLHAITVHPREYKKEWTPLFAKYLNDILTIVKKYSADYGRTSAPGVNRHPYPKSFIRQIEYLLEVYNDRPAERPDVMIVLPQHAKTVREWLNIFKHLDAKYCQAYAMQVSQAFMGEHNLSMDDLAKAIHVIPALFKIMRPKIIEKLLSHPYAWLGFVYNFSAAERSELLQSLSNDEFLALIKASKFFSCVQLSEQEKGIVLQRLDKYPLREIVTDYNNLMGLIVLLPADKVLSVLIDLGSVCVRNIVNFAVHLASILKELPRENWKCFFDILGKERINTLLTANGLANIFKSLQNNQLKLDQFIQFVGPEVIREKVADRWDLNCLLKALPKNKIKQFLKEIIGSEALNKIFFAGATLFYSDKYQRLKEEVISEAVAKDSGTEIIRHHSVENKEDVANMMLALNIAENPDYPGDLPVELPPEYSRGYHTSYVREYFGVLFEGGRSGRHEEKEDKTSHQSREKEIREYCASLYVKPKPLIPLSQSSFPLITRREMSFDARAREINEALFDISVSMSQRISIWGFRSNVIFYREVIETILSYARESHAPLAGLSRSGYFSIPSPQVGYQNEMKEEPVTSLNLRRYGR